MINSSPQPRNRLPGGQAVPGKMPLDQMPLEIDPLGLDRMPLDPGRPVALDTEPLSFLPDPAEPKAVPLDLDDVLPEPKGFEERLARKQKEEARRRREDEEGPVHLPELENRTRPKSVHDRLDRGKNRKRLPLSKVGQGDDSPSFYLSLSDLMSLLLVFFVLIFSMSELSIGTVKEAPKTQQVTAPDRQNQADPQNQPINKPMAKAMASPVKLEDQAAANAPQDKKASGGPMNLPRTGGLPGMTREAGPINLGLVVATFDAPGAPKTGKAKSSPPETQPKAVRGLAVDKSLLAMVTMSKPAPQAALPVRPKPKEPKHKVQLGMLQRDLQPTLAEGMEVTAATDRLIIRLPESITFALGDAEIKKSMRKRLSLLAVKLSHHTGYQIVITGHTDDIPISNQRFASNWELSAARAAAVGRSLLAQGVDRRRIAIKGMADTRPLMVNDGETNREKNRRVEIELHPV